MKKGFTLVEILVAVMIITILVTVAMPIFDRAIEKSRVGEARTLLKNISDAKERMLDTLEKSTYNSSDFGFSALDVRIPYVTAHSETQVSTKNWTYSLTPEGNVNGVCAARRTGDYKGVNLLFLGPSFVDGGARTLCSNGASTDGCTVLGFGASSASAYCLPL